MPSPAPANIDLVEPALLRIEWDDAGALATDFPAWELRVVCRCAACVNEVSGQRMLDSESVPKETVVVDAWLTGSYGIGLAFSDGHGTGIYSWEYLLSLVDPLLRAEIVAADEARALADEEEAKEEAEEEEEEEEE